MRILFLDIDTLRADHLGCYGYDAAHQPEHRRRRRPWRPLLRGARVRRPLPAQPHRAHHRHVRYPQRCGEPRRGRRRPGVVGRPNVASWRPTSSVRSPAPSSGGATTRCRSRRSRCGTAPRGGPRVTRAGRTPPAAWASSGPTRCCPTPSTGSTATRRTRDWMLHVHLWDPHTPYNVPPEYGDPFADAPVPSWYTDEVRQQHWDLPGPHSAQEPFGFAPASGVRRRAVNQSPSTHARGQRAPLRRLRRRRPLRRRRGGSAVLQARRPRAPRRHRHLHHAATTARGSASWGSTPTTGAPTPPPPTSPPSSPGPEFRLRSRAACTTTSM